MNATPLPDPAMTYEHDRAHFRIQYPVPSRPVFLTSPAAEGNEVVDCSERGLRYRPAHGSLPDVGAETKGTVRFLTGVQLEVSGVVVRIQEGEVAVHLNRSAIPWKVVLQEQVFLRKRYPVRA